MNISSLQNEDEEGAAQTKEIDDESIYTPEKSGNSFYAK